MGIAPNGGFGADCLTCWPAGTTPKQVYLSVIGIKKAPAWAPPDPEPPVGKFTLVQTLPCSWEVIIPAFGLFGYDTNGPGSGIAIITTLAVVAFSFFDPADCVFAGGNQNPQDPKHYTGGRAQITW